MLKKRVKNILESSRAAGWVLEPDAKKIFALSGIKVPEFRTAETLNKAIKAAGDIGYPVAAKVVSPQVLHKSDANGVIIGIDSDEELKNAYKHFVTLDGFECMLIEEMVDGLELIVGGKIDYQFGPVVILGLGGTSVEIYKDTSLKMAPLKENDVRSMVRSLKAHELLEGYRGSEPINMEDLISMMINFSGLLVDLRENIESIDLNPVMCSAQQCVVADARIILS